MRKSMKELIAKIESGQIKPYRNKRPLSVESVKSGSYKSDFPSVGTSLSNMSRTLTRNFTRGQKAMLSVAMKKAREESFQRSLGLSNMHDNWTAAYGLGSWPKYAEVQAAKAIIKNGNKNAAYEAATRAWRQGEAGGFRSDPEITRTRLVNAIKRSDEYRYAVSGGRGSNARGMSGLGLRGGLPASAGGGAVAAKSPSALPAVSLGGSKVKAEDLGKRRSGRAKAYLQKP